jgi:hypothetical protein
MKILKVVYEKSMQGPHFVYEIIEDERIPAALLVYANFPNGITYMINFIYVFHRKIGRCTKKRMEIVKEIEGEILDIGDNIHAPDDTTINTIINIIVKKMKDMIEKLE